MSFEDLKKSSYAARREEFKVQDYTFYANELSYLQRLNVSAVQQTGGDYASHLVVASITDQDGKHMTMGQFLSLDHTIQEEFFVKAAKINSGEGVKKKSKPRAKTKSK